jgi:hypothetical protein
MIRADQDIVREVLHPYEDAIFKLIHGAWDDWRGLTLGGRLLFPARARACLVHDFMVQRAIAAWADDGAVRIVQQDETAKFVVNDRVLLRFKKADDRGLGSKIPTQASLSFVDQEQELPGIPDAHKIEIVYILNRLQTQIDRIVVVARNGDERLWDYAIAPAQTAEIIPLPFITSTDMPRGAWIKVRTSGSDADKKKDSGE